MCISIKVLAALLGDPRRADWKMCLPRAPAGGPSLEEAEGAQAEGFKAAFAQWDPANRAETEGGGGGS